MSLLPTIGAIDQDTGFYNGVATQSVRFNQPSSSYLYKSVSDGTRTKSTFAWWMKRGQTTIGSSNIGEIFCFGGSGGGGSQSSGRIILEANKLHVSQEDNNSVTWDLQTTQLFRDHSSWYHCVVVIDTTQSTDSDRVKVYINGNKVTSFSTASYPSEDLSTRFGLNGVNKVGVGEASGSPWSATYFDGYFADMYYLDGVAVSDSSDVISEFGEFKNGVWIAKEYTGSFGTNGIRFKFDQVGVGTASTSTIGADTSGNTNHYTSSGIDADGCNMPDSPENNFCTMNPPGRRYGQTYVSTFSEGSLKVTNADYSSNSNGNSSHNWGTMAINQIASEGGVYFEVRMDALDTNRSYLGVIGDNGTDNKNTAAAGAAYSFPIKAVLATSLYLTATTDTDGTSVDLRSGNTVFGNGEVAGVAIKSDGKLFIHREGTYLKDASGNVGNPSTGANPLVTIDLTSGDWLPYVGYNSNFTLNFGQDPTFAGNETAPDPVKQDANGIGRFLFDVPTNYLAMCSSNMAEPTIGPNSTTTSTDHFKAKIYEGVGYDSDSSYTQLGQDVVVGFKPDLVWIKNRDKSNHNHSLFDSSRGATKRLLSNLPNAEGTESTALTDFDVTGGGFTLGVNNEVNENDDNFISWNWKANGSTTSSNTDGTTTSTVQANTTAGFSIVTYAGNSASKTVGHGLDSAPEWVIVKSRTDSERWAVFHTSISNQYIYLNENFAGETSNADERFGNSSSVVVPNSTVVTLGANNSDVNENGDNYIMYCFHSVEGYSKFGSYVANENADGPFIYTGFRPALVVVKKIDTAHGWEVTDSARNPFNEMDKHLLWDTAAGDTTADPYDFYANGFKLRTSGYTRNRVAGKVLLYMAFAEAPFKYANAR